MANFWSPGIKSQFHGDKGKMKCDSIEHSSDDYGATRAACNEFIRNN